MKILAFIPARGGSKTVGMKNMLCIGGIPLVGWALRAACLNKALFCNVVLSTDHPTIREYCSEKFPRVTISERPLHLRGDAVPIEDVVLNYLNQTPDAPHPHAVALFQPTSPFIRQYQIEHLILRLSSQAHVVRSAYTITPIPHNYHWTNQRGIFNREIEFIFPKARKEAWNKQKKGKVYKFGNLVITKTQFIKDGFFSSPATYLEIDSFDSIDVDNTSDHKLAQMLFAAGCWENGDR